MIEFHKEALFDFDRVIHKCPKNAHAYFRRGFSNKALGVNIFMNNIYLAL